jgi:hypothetical protein
LAPQEWPAVELLDRQKPMKILPAEGTVGQLTKFKKAVRRRRRSMLHRRSAAGLILCRRPQSTVIRVGSLVVHKLGEIVTSSPYFHNESQIYPLNYRATRIFWSCVRPMARCPWVCQILSREEPLPPDAEVWGKVRLRGVLRSGVAQSC